VQTYVPKNSPPTKVSEVNVSSIYFTITIRGVKKTKNKSNKNSNQTENTKTQAQLPVVEK
jgi:hypothetical protein